MEKLRFFSLIRKLSYYFFRSDLILGFLSISILLMMLTVQNNTSILPKATSTGQDGRSACAQSL